MKLTKISLAAVVALGTLSTTAMAADLSEVIKGVDASGYLRHRYTEYTIESNGGVSGKDSSTGTHEFKAGLTLKTPKVDNLQAIVNVTYKATDSSSSERAKDTAETAQPFNVKEMYAIRTFDATKTQIHVGKMTVGAPVTDDMKANGVKVLNSDIKNVTLAGVYLDNLEADGDIAVAGLSTAAVGSLATDTDTVKNSNLMAAAAIASFAPVNAQVWYFTIPDAVSSLWFAQVDAEYDMFSGKVQYGMSSLDEDFRTKNGKTTYNDASALAAEVGVTLKDVKNLNVSVGYIGRTADNEGTSSTTGIVSIEDDGSFIDYTEQLIAYNAVTGENTAFFGQVNADVVKDVNLGLAYTVNTQTLKAAGANTDYDGSEWTLRAGYKYNKNWAFSSYYSMMTAETGANTDDQNDNIFRVETKYSFK